MQGKVPSREKNAQYGSGSKSAASKATTVNGPATGGRLGGRLQGGYVTGDRKARGKA